jgi:hypothetical protein
MYGFAADGVLDRAIISFLDGGSHKVASRTIAVDGAVSEGTNTVKPVDKDTFTYTFSNAAGSETFVMKFTRVK